MRRGHWVLVMVGAALLVIAVAAGGLWAFARYVRPGPTTALPLPRASLSPPVPTAQTPTPVPLVSTLAPAPSSRINAAMVYDAARKDVVLFGGCSAGCSGSDYLGDTWTWDGARWTQHTPANSPPARYRPAIVYDAAHSLVVMFGGANGDFSDTWTWNGKTWAEMHPLSKPLPLVNGTMEMDYDPALQRVVLFAVGETPYPRSMTTETWTWDGMDWTQLTPPQSPAFPSGFGFAMAYYPPSRQMVLVAQAMWAFDGTTWRQVASSGDGPVNDATLSYDARTKTLVMLESTSETLTWDGAAWRNPTPPAAPPQLANGGASMTYDASRGVVVLFGGATYYGRSNLVWSWNGSTWTNHG